MLKKIMSEEYTSRSPSIYFASNASIFSILCICTMHMHTPSAYTIDI